MTYGFQSRKGMRNGEWSNDMADRMMAASRVDRQTNMFESPRRSWEGLPVQGGGPHREEGSDGDLFTVECDDLSGDKKCPVAKQPKLSIPRAIYEDWRGLCRAFRVEWQAHVVGKYDESAGLAEVESFYFNPQVVSAATVTNVESLCEYRPGTIGCVHSHVDMGAFFSGQDVAHANWPVEIVINSRGEIKCIFRLKLECGRYARVPARVVTVGTPTPPPSFDALKDALTKGIEWEAGRRNSSQSEHTQAAPAPAQEAPAQSGGTFQT